MSASVYWWNAAGLFLVVLWILQRAFRFRGGFAVAVLLAGVFSVAPWFGHTPRHWLSALTPNISVPLFVLLLAAVARRAGAPSFFGAREWSSAWIFGCAAALVLYPSALGLGLPNFDSYSLGWPWLEWGQSFLLFGTVGACAGFLLWRGNRFGWVLAACAALYLLGLQESRNFWDYMVDPLYAVVSLVLVSKTIADRLRRR